MRFRLTQQKFQVLHCQGSSNGWSCATGGFRSQGSAGPSNISNIRVAAEAYSFKIDGVYVLIGTTETCDVNRIRAAGVAGN